MLNQKEYKAIKREIVEESAFSVGYFEGILSKLPSEILIDVVKDLVSDGTLNGFLERYELQNIMVTETIKQMTYQDFKKVASYFFSYPNEARLASREEVVQVRPIEISQSYFEELKANADELLRIKASEQAPKSVTEMVDTIETNYEPVPSGFEVVGVKPETDDYLIIHRGDSYLGDHFLEDSDLLLDYRDSRRPAAQILDYLASHFPKVEAYLNEFFNDNYYEATGELDGKELVETYFETEQMTFEGLADLKTTADLYQVAIMSTTFKQDYPTYRDFLNELSSPDYMATHANQIVDHDHHIEAINELLREDGKQLAVEEVTGYSQGDSWTLGALYNPEEVNRATMKDYLKHQVGAWLKGSLVEAFVTKGETILSEGLQEAMYQASHYQILDEELLWGEDKVQALESWFDLTGFESPEVLEAEEEADEDLERE